MKVNETQYPYQISGFAGFLLILLIFIEPMTKISIKSKGLSMETRGKRQRVKHQEVTLKYVLGGIPKDVLGILKRMLTRLDFFLLCEAFNCQTELMSDFDLLRDSVNSNSAHLVAWVLSRIQVTRQLKSSKSNVFQHIAARNGNIEILRLLKRFNFPFSRDTSWWVLKGTGSLECFRFLVEECGCDKDVSFCRGHLDLILYVRTYRELDWISEYLTALMFDRIPLIEYCRDSYDNIFRMFYHNTFIYAFEKDRFVKIISDYGIRVTLMDVKSPFFTNNRKLVYETMTEMGDFFLTAEAKEFILTQEDLPVSLREGQ